ncbi:hypothetical protein B0H94_10730 [Salsuginibacillus halophilus]|uniref:Uncharacterized protein n=1 Tax=Salsuginibacillus halophilus TaxID=517424 RepID=A0A2P8HFP7_9BACI|nr:hypothetical protein [Salsuginibacillus halophilus]PSL45025.1 hypothetical protein B0H94_10730 [Salsuginibacillus halophilus]
MEDLFQLLLANFFWVILLIAGLMSLFRRQGGQQQEQGRGQSRPSSGGGQRGAPRDWREVFQEEASDEAPPTRRVPDASRSQRDESDEPVIQSEKFDEYSKQMEDLQRKREQAEERLNEAAGDVANSAVGQEVKRRVSNAKLNLETEHLTKDEAMKAFVWSEVFGPPRAKRPHQTEGLHRSHKNQ